MKTIDVAAGLVFKDNLLLIAQRFPDAHLGGLWEFPGGKREQNETFQECLRRELLEELGISVDVHEMIEEIAHAYTEKAIRIKFFRCTLKSGEAKPLGCAAVRWASREQLKDYAFPAADEKLLRLLSEQAQLWTA
jgi:mutator protein MutT